MSRRCAEHFLFTGWLTGAFDYLCYGVFCKFLGDFGYVWEGTVFLKGFVKFREQLMLKI